MGLGSFPLVSRLRGMILSRRLGSHWLAAGDRFTLALSNFGRR